MIRAEEMSLEFNQMMEKKVTIPASKKKLLTLPEAVHKIVVLQQENLSLKQEISRLKHKN